MRHLRRASLTAFAPYPPTVSFVIAFGDNLYPAGPVPLPVAEGGHASGGVSFLAEKIENNPLGDPVSR
ncbi:MAG: hypothetical protein J6N46_04095 [Bacteroidales bacterium]|nr:hypothetical protein [Bacteroidales bacterium]MBO6221094.1 hypothetical protein [Bacteroidales bacterium]